MEGRWELPPPAEDEESSSSEASTRAQRRTRRFLLAGLAGLAVWAVIAGVFVVNLRENEKDQGGLPAGLEEALPQWVNATEATVKSLKKEEIDLAGRLITDLPGDSDAIDLMALVHESYGNWAEAIIWWQQALDRNPDHADAFDALGWVAMQKGEHEEAVELLRRALEIDSAMPGVHNNLAGALVTLGKREEALEVLAEAIEIFPRDARSHIMLGQVYLDSGEYERARRSFEIALEIQPGHRNACYGLATAYARLGRRDEFRQSMEQFKTISAEELDARVDRIRRFDDLASVRRGASQTHTSAGRIYFAHGHLAKARDHWLRAAALDPTNTACRMELARLDRIGI